MNENEIMLAGKNLPTVERQMTVPELKEQVQVIQMVLADVMKSKVHYDIIPGTQKPTLLKAGVEKNNMVFRIGSEPEIERDFDGFDTHFHVKVRMFDIRTGNTLGYGVGEGSTNESKWAWRKAVCHEEFESTMETKRRIHWQKKFGSKTEYEAVEQVRQNPADIQNTVLKMAVKRAEVDGCRKVTACSDVFDQVLDESHIREAVGVDTEPDKPSFQRPQRKTEAAPVSEPETPENVISEAQRKRLFAIGKGRNLTNEEMKFIVYDVAGVNSSNDIPKDKYEAVVNAYESAETGKILPN